MPVQKCSQMLRSGVRYGQIAMLAIYVKWLSVIDIGPETGERAAALGYSKFCQDVGVIEVARSRLQLGDAFRTPNRHASGKISPARGPSISSI